MNVKINNVSKSFGDKNVLKNFYAELPEGEISVLMGPSGCGKTTLFRILLGLEIAESGTVEGVSEKKAAVFQEDRLLPGLSAVQNVCLMQSGKVSREDAETLLSALGLQGSGHLSVDELSGGMRRRVALARALLADADFLALDEPLKGLDRESRAQACEVIREYTKGKTVFVITHSSEEARLLSGNILKMP